MQRIQTESMVTDRPQDGPAEPDADPVVELIGVSRVYGTEAAVSDLTLSIYEGELVTLLGPSGCGKTTTLRLLAGLDRPDSGRIRIRGDVVAGQSRFVPPEERDIGLIFQDFALFPHLSVGENIAYGIQDWPDEEVDSRVEDLLDLVDMQEYRDNRPETLSGGQRQRVALARSLAPEPDVLLLDEPFSNLDVGLRKVMREEVRRILKAAGVTAISVTHDQEEALSISDRVAVIAGGHLEQVGRPELVFQHPESRFVAEFLGQAGFISGSLTEGSIETGIGRLDVDIIKGLGPEYEGARIDVLVRPDDLRARPANGEEANGRIVHREYTGPSFVYRIELDSGDVVHCDHNHDERLDLDQPVHVSLTADHPLAWFPAV